MRLLADENVHGKVVATIRQGGHALAWVKELDAGARDDAILLWPGMASTIFITNDRDVTDLIFRAGLPAPLAVLYTRTEHRQWALTASLLLAELERDVTPGQIATFTKDGVRRRDFPAGASNG